MLIPKCWEKGKLRNQKVIPRKKDLRRDTDKDIIEI